MNQRAVILSTAILFFFVVVLVRLTDRMLINHEELSAKARRQHVKKEDVRVRRGVIYDRRGRELAVNLEVESLYGNPRKIKSPKSAARKVARTTGVSYRRVLKSMKSDRRFVWLDRKVGPEAAAKLRKLDIEGLGFLPDAKRYYPKKSLAAHVVGFAGVDNQALGGVELSYEGSLTNEGGRVYVIRDASGRTLSEGVEFERRGNSLVLTIDEGLQYIAEEALSAALKKWGSSEGSVVMMDPYTGEIFALVNRPTYDPNRAGDFRSSARRNRAVTDTFEPGSTFKLVAAAAVLEEGAAGPETKFDCRRGYLEVGGARIKDTRKGGICTLKEIIQKSSNVGAVLLGMKVGKEALYEYARAFGFGQKTGVDLPGEVQGRLRPPGQWSEMSIGSVSIGYEVAVTALQVLRAYAAVANGGYLVTPHVVRELRSPEGYLIRRFAPPVGPRAVSSRTAMLLKDILKSVTEEGGTAQLAAVYGNSVAGKTGTTRIYNSATGTYSTEDYVSSFVGFVPAERPRLAMIVVLHKPRGEIFGGTVAAPVFSEIAAKALSYLNVPMDDSKGNNLLVLQREEDGLERTSGRY